MTAHVRTCANCGAGPATVSTASGACCWNPVGCGCGAVNARFDLPGASQADLTGAEGERDAIGVKLVEAIRLLEYALHLRQHGERAPGGTETWAEFDQCAETFLRQRQDPAAHQPTEGTPDA